MTDNVAAGLREQLINARADLRVKDEQLNSAYALLREKHEKLRIKDEQLRMKDEQLASKDKHYQEQLRLKDERYDRLLAVKDEQLRVKDEQHHQQILGFVQLGNNFLDKMGGDVNRLKTTHTGIDRYMRHIPPLLTRQPSEKKKHVIVVLAHQEEDGKYETQTIAGQKEYVDRITKHVPEDEFLCEIEDDGNPIDTHNNLTRALRRELSVRTRGRLEAPATKLGNCRSHGHQDELPVEVFAEMLEQLHEEHQHGTLVANEYERDRIIDDIKVLINNLFDGIRNHDECKTAFMYALNGINSRVDILYNTYKQTIERFNIGIIAYISDYYSIVDQHSDQFHHKYLHTYSANKNHYNPILSIFNSTKFDIEEFVNIFKQHCYEFKRFKFHTDASHLRRTRERTWIIYQNLSNYIASENVYDLSDALMHEFDSIITDITNITEIDSGKANGKKTKKTKIKLNQDIIDIFNRLKYIMQQFHNIKLDFKPAEEMLDYCEWGNTMQVMAGSSEMLCDNCGYLYELKGTVFDDIQFYSQDGARYKHAGYEPSKHCRCWLERIQAKETNTITETQLQKIEQCIKRDGIANKKRVSIEQLRRYLKDSGLTDLNEHVALIKRLITGIVPPQLTYSETQDITNSFSKAVKAYNIIRPSNKNNMLFYPFILHRLVEMHVSEFSKRKCLLSFIHLQGTQMLIQNDKIWLQICNVTPGFRYKPTDRYEYMD